jgi:hypothetical protein
MVGDIIEVPFWYQEGRKSYWQVEDIDRKMEFESFMITVTASPMNDTQETTEIPNIPSNSGIMATLKIDMNDEQIANFTEDGYDTTEVVLDNEPVTRDPYDPRPDATEDFLDNPTVLLNQ